MADVLYHETLHHLAGSKNALDWYKGKVDTMFHMLDRVYPELSKDPGAKGVFTTILAVTSNGVNVVKNFDLTFEHYDKIRERVAKGDYTIPEDLKGTKEATAMNRAFGAWNTGVTKFGAKEFLDILERPMKVSELKKFAKDELGVKFSASEQASTTVPVASIFGPKIGGGFWANLRGIHDYVTQDRWFVRTMSRLEGRMYKQEGFGDEQRARFVQALQEGDPTELGLPARDWSKASEDEVNAAALKVFTLDNKQGFPRSPSKGNGKLIDGKPLSDANNEIRQSAKLGAQGLKGEMRSQPEGAKQRTAYRKIINDIVERLHNHGIPMTAADLQAVIWFPEQRFWQQALKSGTKKTDADYEDAAVMGLLKRGRDNDVRSVYSRMGHSDAEIEEKIKDRRDKLVAISKEKAGD
jgi:hypothetical protein